MDSSTIGIVVFLASFFAARLVNERALKGLKEDEAARLLKGFSRYRIFSLVGVIVIVTITSTDFFLARSSSTRVSSCCSGHLWEQVKNDRQSKAARAADQVHET